MNKYHTLQLDTSVVEKNKEATRFGNAATHSTLWDPVPGQNLQQQGDSRSQKGWRAGKGGYFGDHKLPGGSWGHSKERRASTELKLSGQTELLPLGPPLARTLRTQAPVPGPGSSNPEQRCQVTELARR